MRLSCRVLKCQVREGLPDDMEEFLAKNKHTYIINASANAHNCWIFIYWTRLGVTGEYDVHRGGHLMNEYSEITRRINDIHNKNRCTVRSAAFGSGRDTIFLRASNSLHQWSFRWNLLPFDCDMIVQDSIEENGWKERRPTVGGKKNERVAYYDTSTRALGCIRSLTIGKNDAWIIYGETWHMWDGRENKLPPALLHGLEMGMACGGS